LKKLALALGVILAIGAYATAAYDVFEVGSVANSMLCCTLVIVSISLLNHGLKRHERRESHSGSPAQSQDDPNENGDAGSSTRSR